MFIAFSIFAKIYFLKEKKVSKKKKMCVQLRKSFFIFSFVLTNYFLFVYLFCFCFFCILPHLFALSSYFFILLTVDFTSIYINLSQYLQHYKNI